MSYFIGLMSGTSMDGIDAALVDFSQPSQPVMRDFLCVPYSDTLKRTLLALNFPMNNEVHEMARASREVALAFADAANQLIQRHPDYQIHAIGSHGQTIRHAPGGPLGYSLQLGDANTLAVTTGINVVSDFRNKDIALGGQGAPLVPAFHASVFARSGKRRGILNIGGISNITLLTDQDTLGFDTGPGNTLMDQWIALHLGHAYDKNGEWAASGRVIPALLNALLQHPFLQECAPKSTGIDHFSLHWLQQHLDKSDEYAAADVQATLLHFTARSIADACQSLALDDLFVCGGGAYNTHLMNTLRELMPAVHIDSTDVLNIPANAVEACAFAWLAYAFVNQIPGNLPAVTGASRPAILGTLTYAH